MRFSITGIGIWARGLTSAQDLATLLDDPGAAPVDNYEKPKPAAIPARERRRSGELINLAVEAAHQACAAAGVAPAEVASVFSSALSDTAVTDYMGRKLAGPEKMLSPTKFHNSVHNAASGYWSISAVNRAPSTFVSGFEESFGAGLLEAVSLCMDREAAVLYVAYDMANSAPFNDFAGIDESLATAFVLVPGRDSDAATFELTLPGASNPSRSSVPTPPGHPYLAELASKNLSGAGLTLAEASLADRPTFTIPFTPTRSFTLERLNSEVIARHA